MPVLVDVGNAISSLPKVHTWHRQIKRVYDQRRAMIETGEGVDWAMAEALAFGTLVNEGADSFKSILFEIISWSYGNARSYDFHTDFVVKVCCVHLQHKPLHVR